jgi:hypothetical protein
MAILAAVSLLAGLLLAGCGRGAIPPEAVVRAWSDAVNTGENDRAASQLGRGAIVIQGADERVLHTQADAVAWNQALPCASLVMKIQTHKDIVTATFRLGDRGVKGSCAAAGGTATIEFEVRHNLIVFLRQLSSTPPPSP